MIQDSRADLRAAPPVQALIKGGNDMGKVIAAIFTLFLVVVAGSGLSMAAEQDVKGGKDHPLLSRMPNFRISEYKETEFNAHKFVGQDKKQVSVEGHKYYIEYKLNKGAAEPGELKIRRNIQNALKNIGGNVIFDDNFNRASTVVLQSGDKETWVEVRAYNNMYRLTIVEKEEMKQEVTAGAAATGTEVKTAVGSSHEFKDPYKGGIRLGQGGGEPGKAYMALVDAMYKKDYVRVCKLGFGNNEQILAQCLQKPEDVEAFVAMLTGPKSHKIVDGYLKGEEATLDVAYTVADLPDSYGIVVMTRHQGGWFVTSFGGSASTEVNAQVSGTVDMGMPAEEIQTRTPAERREPSSDAGLSWEDRIARECGRADGQEVAGDNTGPALGKWTFEGKDDKGVVWTGTLIVTEMDKNQNYACNYHSWFKLEAESKDEGYGTSGPSLWHPLKRKVSFIDGSYTAILSADGKKMTGGKWTESEEDFRTRKVTVKRTGVWSAEFKGQ
jgi:hypothetical protein